MPLRDHFRSPVNDTHSWDEVHGQWPAEIVRQLSTILPSGYRAAPKVHLGGSFEVDIGTFDSTTPSRSPDLDNGGRGGTLTAITPTFSVESELLDQDEYEVRVFDTNRGRQLVAAIEIISPSNKDRPESREIFVGKVTALLLQGVCVSLIDLVTIRQSNLYAEVLAGFDTLDPELGAEPPHLYGVTMRTSRRHRSKPHLEAWFYPMEVGGPLPTLPIWLESELRVMLPLEVSYQQTCQILQIR